MILQKRDFDVVVDCLVREGVAPMRAHIRRVRNGVFELTSPVCLKPGRQLTMRHPERSIEAQVTYCQSEESGTYTLGVVMALDRERRREVRTPVDLPAMLRIADSSDQMPVRVVDLSSFGVGFQLATAIAVGALVHIDLRTGTATGEVRHCTRRGDKCRAGIHMREFLLPPGGERLIVLNAAQESSSEQAIEGLKRSIQERQLRYEAVLYSLAQPQ